MDLLVAILVVMLSGRKGHAKSWNKHIMSAAANHVAGAEGISCYECSGYENSEQPPHCSNKVTCKQSEGCFVSRSKRHNNSPVQYEMGCKLKTQCGAPSKETAHVRRQTGLYMIDTVARWQENQETASLGGRHQHLHSQSIASMKWQTTANGGSVSLNGFASAADTSGIRHHHSHHHGQQTDSSPDASIQVDEQALTFHTNSHHSSKHSRPSANNPPSVVNASAGKADANGFRHRYSHQHGQQAASSLEASAQIAGHHSTFHSHDHHPTTQGRPSANNPSSVVSGTAEGADANGFRHHHSQQLVSSLNTSAQVDGQTAFPRHSHHNTRDLYSNVDIRRVHISHNGKLHTEHGGAKNALHLCDVCCFEDDCNVWNTCQNPTERQESIQLDVIVPDTTPRTTDAPTTKYSDVTTPARVMNPPDVGGYTFACQSTDPSSCATALCNDDFFRFFCPRTCGLCP